MTLTSLEPKVARFYSRLALAYAAFAALVFAVGVGLMGMPTAWGVTMASGTWAGWAFSLVGGLALASPAARRSPLVLAAVVCFVGVVSFEAGRSSWDRIGTHCVAALLGGVTVWLVRGAAKLEDLALAMRAARLNGTPLAPVSVEPGARADQPDLPGRSMRKWVAGWLSPKTIEREIDPLIADIQHEYCLAIARGDRAVARGIIWRGRINFALLIIRAVAMPIADTIRAITKGDRS